MKRLAGIAALLLAVALPHATGQSLQALAGHWEGAFSREGSVQLCALDIGAPTRDPAAASPDDALVATLDIPELGMFDEPLSECVLDGSTVRLRCVYGELQGVLHAEAGEISALNDHWGPPVRLHLKRAPRPPEPILSRELRFDSPATDAAQAAASAAGSAHLAGTLLLPVGASSASRVPGIVIMHGSDIGDRGAWEYRSWGELLARQGLAVLLYDRRGSGASRVAGSDAGAASDAGFAVLADDALAALTSLARQPEVRADRVGLLGTSQSGWIAPLAATRSHDVAFLVLLSPPGVGVFEQELQRVEGEARASRGEDGETLSDEEVAAAVEFTERLLDASRAPDREAAFAELAGESARARVAAWAPFVQIPDSAADLVWFASHDFDPENTLAQVSCPVLAFWGARDGTVPPALNLPPLRAALARSGHAPLTAKVWPDCGHDLERRSALLGDDWSWPAHVWRWARKPPGLVEEIGAFVRAN